MFESHSWACFLGQDISILDSGALVLKLEQTSSPTVPVKSQIIGPWPQIFWWSRSQLNLRTYIVSTVSHVWVMLIPLFGNHTAIENIKLRSINNLYKSLASASELYNHHQYMRKLMFASKCCCKDFELICKTCSRSMRNH